MGGGTRSVGSGSGCILGGTPTTTGGGGGSTEAKVVDAEGGWEGQRRRESRRCTRCPGGAVPPWPGPAGVLEDAGAQEIRPRVAFFGEGGGELDAAM